MLDYAVITEVGEKEANEDAVRVCFNRSLFTYGFILADGLGGYGHGDIASRFVVDCCSAALENASAISSTFMDECFDKTQSLLMQEKERTGYVSIRTTLVMLLTDGETAQWGHIGDSRLYLFRRGKQAARTLDHSVPQMLALQKKIKEKDIRHHPDRNRLLRAMGEEWDEPWYEIDQRNVSIKPGDTFLLCSDGFWEWIDEKTVIGILKKNLPAYDSLELMKAVVQENGRGKGMDNYSAILVNVQ